MQGRVINPHSERGRRHNTHVKMRTSLPPLLQTIIIIIFVGKLKLYVYILSARVHILCSVDEEEVQMQKS
jgi:hypothetical protein